MKWNLNLALFLCLLGLTAGVQAQTCNAHIPATTPSEDFTIHDNGTVTHNRTGLMWKRCTEDSAWNGATCTSTGTATTFTWANALTAAVASTTAGYSDWRLPNLKELESIVEDKCYGPSINTAIFPNTSASGFWSASASAGSSSFAWYVYFYDGFAFFNVKDVGYQVRLVRAGQSFGSFDSNDTVALAVSKSGAGTVSSGSAIDCGSTCSAQMGRGWQITLAATPAANLIAWGGACSGSAATCVVTMDSAKSVTASFLNTPLVSGLPAALSFALQNIGSTSAAQTATLTNTGTAALSFAGIAASGDFAVNHNCGAGLVVGGSCTLNVSFTPTARGARTGTLTIDSNAPDSPHTVSLSGTGQGGVVSLSRSSLTFSSQMQGTSSAAQTITLSNPGGAPLNIAGIVASGDFSRSTTCGASLAAGASCSIGVTFSPAATGPRVGTLTLTSDADGSPHTVNLSGTGLPAPVVTFDPGTLNFAGQRVGTTSAAQSVLLSNTGAAALSISGIASTSSDFAVSHNCGSGLGSGGFCHLTVSFAPAVAGAWTGTITISSNAPGSPHALSLSGTGISQFAPLCSLSAAPARVRKGQAAVLTASCNPAATSYTWTGGACAGTTTASCTVSPTKTTDYSVTGINGDGSSTAGTTVRVMQGIAPILNLLLD